MHINLVQHVLELLDVHLAGPVHVEGVEVALDAVHVVRGEVVILE